HPLCGTAYSGCGLGHLNPPSSANRSRKQRCARHNIKTGNYVPVEVLAEVNQKTDDGKPGSGRLQFSTYAGAGDPPPVGGAANACTDADSTSASWLQTGGADNCGAATLLY